jgi:hypothetical protein
VQTFPWEVLLPPSGSRAGGRRVLRNKIYVQRNNVAYSRNQCCNEKAAIHSKCIVELHDTVKNIKTLSVAHKFFYGQFTSLATIKRAKVLL